ETSTILEPPRPARPPGPTDGMAERSGCLLLMMSTASWIASSDERPALAALPDSGNSAPIFTSAADAGGISHCAAAGGGAGEPNPVTHNPLRSLPAVVTCQRCGPTVPFATK